MECTQVGGTGSIYTYYGPDEKLFANLTNNFLTKDIKLVMPSLGLASEPIPLWWTGDFILASPEGTPPEQEKWIIGEYHLQKIKDAFFLSFFSHFAANFNKFISDIR